MGGGGVGAGGGRSDKSPHLYLWSVVGLIIIGSYWVRQL